MKYAINEVILGKDRIMGYECYNSTSKDIVGMTSKQVKDAIAGGEVIQGFKLDDEGELVINSDFCKNLMQKSGINTLTPKNQTDCIVNLIYTVVGRVGSECEVVSSRFFHGNMTEEKIKTLYELGAVNGILIDTKGKVKVYGEETGSAEEITADKVL